MPDVITERELAAACRETLRQWPQARAAVLFGSRARGTAHPDSDRDVAIVLEGGELRRNARALGTLPYVVCRDGRVLAGEWSRPGPEQMQQEAAVNSEDWARRMELAWEKADTAIRLTSRMAEAGEWRRSASHCSSFLEAGADAAELLVKAAWHGVPADRTHDVARLAAAFAVQRPDKRAPAERMAALNGDGRAHHMTMYGFRPPEVPDVRASVGRLAGTLDLRVLEVETGDDDGAGQVPGLVRFAAVDNAAWHGLVITPVTPRPDEGHAAQASGETVLALRPKLAEAIAAFQDRIRRVIEGPQPVEERPDSSPAPG